MVTRGEGVWVGKMGEGRRKIQKENKRRGKRKTQVVAGYLSQSGFFLAWKEAQITIYFFRICSYEY